MPAQTRGFLFSDLRGYSAYTERHGDRAARELLTRYRRIVREAITSFGGAEIRTEGDSFYVVFDSVSAAVEAGLAIQTALAGSTDGEPIRAGIGIHAGEVEDDAEQGIVSSAVNIAARICAAAEPGEVLVSETVQSLTRTYLDVRYVPRGRRKMKGIANPVVVYRVVPDSHQPTLRNTRRAPVILVAVSGVLAAVAGLAALNVAAQPTASQVARPQSSVTNSGESSASAGPASPVATATFPNPIEASLLDLVDESFRPTCEPPDADEIPRYTETRNDAVGPHSFPVTVRGGIVCSPFGGAAPDYLSLMSVSMPFGLNETDLIYNLAGTRGASEGSCEEQLPAMESWTAGPVSGHRLCLVAEHAVIYWTYSGSSIIGRATRHDRDMEALLAWWNTEARYRNP